MTVGVLLLAVAAALLTAGAELFVEHAAAAGRRLRVSGVAIALLLAGAEPEELVTAVVAAVRDRPGIAAGDAIGANVTMLTLIAGGLLLVAGRVPRLTRELIGAVVAGGAAAATLLDGRVGRLEGGLLLALYAVLVAVVWRLERRPPAIGELAETDEDDEDVDTGRGLLLALVGIAVMGSGGYLAVLGAERVVQGSGLGEATVGLTLVALATTAELWALLWASHRRGVPELAVAGLLGSVIYNATVTLGAAALARPLVTDVTAAAIVAAALPVAFAVLRRAGRLGGTVLVGGYLALAAALLTSR